MEVGLCATLGGGCLPGNGWPDPQEPFAACGRKWCAGGWSTVGTFGRRVVGGDRRYFRENAGDGCVQGTGTVGGWRELIGVRFPVDVVSKACDRGRDVRGR